MERNREREKELAARAAVEQVEDGQVVGLGTGSTMAYAIKAIGERVARGLAIRAVATSARTRMLAQDLGIPIVDINAVEAIDLTIDGADEFNPDLVLVKGGGGALLKEKIVAARSRREIIVVDSSKRVGVLGAFKLPIEVVPFAEKHVLARLRALGGSGKARTVDGTAFLTEAGNLIVDADFGPIGNPVYLSDCLQRIEGVVEHGLFIRLAHSVIMGDGDSTITFSR
jgi:ribose 5-phosphate isomerase A